MLRIFARSYSAKLRNLTADLHRLDRGLKSNPSLDGAALREFREALDNIRLTAWTTAELLNARRSQKDPRAVLSFLTAERLRRFGQMAKDLSGDLEQDRAAWPAEAINNLRSSLTLLREQLTKVGSERE